jgi:hypothetical protein
MAYLRLEWWIGSDDRLHQQLNSRGDWVFLQPSLKSDFLELTKIEGLPTVGEFSTCPRRVVCTASGRNLASTVRASKRVAERVSRMLITEVRETKPLRASPSPDIKQKKRGQ